MKRWYLLGMAVFWFGVVAEAQTRYVSDELVITFRTGPGNQYNIVRNLTSGARVEVLEESDDGVYARVRLQDGAEGWVLTQYLQAEPTAALRLAAATRELDDASQDSATFEGRAQELEAELTQTQDALDEATSRAERLDAELRDIRSASSEALATRDRNRSLSLEVADLTASLRDSQAEVSELRSRNRQSWFIVGAAVLLGGIVIGLVAPSFRRSRRSNW
jgi:SH3 domain protein